MTRIGSYSHRYNAIEKVKPHVLSLRTESLVAAVIIISTGSELLRCISEPPRGNNDCSLGG